MVRNKISGCSSENTMAVALGSVLDALSQGRRFVGNSRSGVTGIAWKANKGGWVVHNTAWALWGGVIVLYELAILGPRLFTIRIAASLVFPLIAGSVATLLAKMV